MTGSNNENITTSEKNTHERVRIAESEKLEDLKKLLHDYEAEPGDPIFLRAFKTEKLLEIWIQPKGKAHFIKFKTYKICAISGLTGPKMKEGDEQVPEGFYKIVAFNPESKFHLSLKINYPNESDCHFADAEQPGGDIYIHGSCVSKGCLAMTDELIKEIYVICDQARENGQKNIPVHILPFEFGSDQDDIQIWKANNNLSVRWENLKEIDNYFVKHRKPGTIEVDSEGLYRLDSN